MTKIDKKTQKQLLQALERAKKHSHQMRMKREEKLWKIIETPSSLLDHLILLTKSELDDIRNQLQLKGISALKKGELAAELARVIPSRFEGILVSFDQERFDLIQKLIKNGGTMPVDEEFPRFKIEALRSLGIVFPVLKNGKKQLTIPVELLGKFAEIEKTKVQERIHENTEWIHLTYGMLYYYGVMKISKLLERIRELTKRKVDVTQYFEVMSLATGYYKERKVSFTSYPGYVDGGIFNLKKIIEEHEARPTVDYYPFSKKDLLKAANPDFIDKSPEMVVFLRFLSESYDMTNDDTDEIAVHLRERIIRDEHPSKITEYLQSILEIPSLEFFQQLTAHFMEVYNHTRMWILKGYKPVELSKKEATQLNPLPTSQPGSIQTGSNVVDLKSARSKVGRNDPCPCGSGKKHKKCCGKL